MASAETLIHEDLPTIKELRRDLHAHPELAYHERRTSGLVQRYLGDSKIEFVAGLAKGTGVVGYLPATHDPTNARTVALRADMDALPIHEATSLPYASKTCNVMHACGHDGHSSILLGAARTLSQLESRPNNVLFLFQPAEEVGAGGKAMIDDGALTGEKIGRPADVVYGLHCAPFLPLGRLATRVGPMMASTDDIHIRVVGKGGHAAMPHDGVDPVLAAAHVITALQTIASRNVDPLDSIVITISMVHGGAAANVIPNSVELSGTLRTLQSVTREHARQRIRALASSICEGFGARAEIDLVEGYPTVVNHDEATARFRARAKEVVGPDHVLECAPVMGGEDFSFYGAVAPACFFWLGLVPPDRDSYPRIHTPDFDFNDQALEFGVRMMVDLALHG